MRNWTEGMSLAANLFTKNGQIGTSRCPVHLLYHPQVLLPNQRS